LNLRDPKPEKKSRCMPATGDVVFIADGKSGCCDRYAITRASWCGLTR